MKQEDKELLIKDLCARLPYGVKLDTLEGPQKLDIKWLSINMCNIANPYLPYLFPLSSMTEEQKKEFIQYAVYEVVDTWDEMPCECYLSDYVGTPENPLCNYNAIDWCIKNHFDYRGLIPKGLAIDATNLNIY